MALFFLVVGLEIKREVRLGELAEGCGPPPCRAIAAVGGMVVPAAIYLAMNAGGPGVRGWGIAMPTDIAFTLGVAVPCGADAPPGLKPFVLSLAIVDDILTIVVIAVFYSAWTYPGLVLAVGALAVGILGAPAQPRPRAARSTSHGDRRGFALHAAGIPPP